MKRTWDDMSVGSLLALTSGQMEDLLNEERQNAHKPPPLSWEELNTDHWEEFGRQWVETPPQQIKKCNSPLESLSEPLSVSFSDSSVASVIITHGKSPDDPIVIE